MIAYILVTQFEIGEVDFWKSSTDEPLKKGALSDILPALCALPTEKNGLRPL